MLRSTDALQLRRSKLQCCRPLRVEQFTAAPATRRELRAFQASTENIVYSRVSQPRHIVTICFFAP